MSLRKSKWDANRKYRSPVRSRNGEYEARTDRYRQPYSFDDRYGRIPASNNNVATYVPVYPVYNSHHGRFGTSLGTENPGGSITKRNETNTGDATRAAQETLMKHYVDECKVK